MIQTCKKPCDSYRFFVSKKERFLIKEYYAIRRNFMKIEKKLKDKSLTTLERELLEVEKGNLLDQFHRKTFHISCCEEDNYDFEE